MFLSCAGPGAKNFYCRNYPAINYNQIKVEEGQYNNEMRFVFWL